jgi:hypothetical protein
MCSGSLLLTLIYFSSCDFYRCFHGFVQTYYCGEESKFDAESGECKPDDFVDCRSELALRVAMTQEPTGRPAHVEETNEREAEEDGPDGDSHADYDVPQNEACITCVMPLCYPDASSVGIAEEEARQERKLSTAGSLKRTQEQEQFALFPVLGSAGRAYFRCSRRSNTQPRIYLCPENLRFNLRYLVSTHE